MSTQQVRIYLRFLTPPLFVRSVLLGCDHSPELQDLPQKAVQLRARRRQERGQQEEECCYHQEGDHGLDEASPLPPSALPAPVPPLLGPDNKITKPVSRTININFPPSHVSQLQPLPC